MLSPTAVPSATKIHTGISLDYADDTTLRKDMQQIRDHSHDHNQSYHGIEGSCV